MLISQFSSTNGKAKAQSHFVVLLRNVIGYVGRVGNPVSEMYHPLPDAYDSETGGGQTS
jgi:hypothetical protein